MERSQDYNYEQTLNLYLHRGTAGMPKTGAMLTNTPCLKPYVYLPSGPVRGLFAQDGRCFGVSGQHFYEILPSRNKILRGSVQPNSRPASMASNGIGNLGGNQIITASGGFGYIFNLEDNTFQQITDDAFPQRVTHVVYFDGYFVALNGVTGIFGLSSLRNGLEWNGLDFGKESQVSDRTRAMARSHDTLFLFGEKNTSPWYNSGRASFPFEPAGGTIIEHGIDAIHSISALDNTVFWVAGSDLGGRYVVRANGYTPVVVSSSAVSYALSQAPRIDDVIGWAYHEDGHTFYALQVPTLPTTWVYDAKENEWHERAEWNEQKGIWLPHRGRCHAHFNGVHLVGDRLSGMVYEQSLDILEDEVVDV